MLTLPETRCPGASQAFEITLAQRLGKCSARSSWKFVTRHRRGKSVTAVLAHCLSRWNCPATGSLVFSVNWGAPDSVTLDKLISWSVHTNPGVKYFSGTAVYQKEIEIPADEFGSGREIWLDLGKVKNFAEVSLNGTPFGVLWKPPSSV